MKWPSLEFPSTMKCLSVVSLGMMLCLSAGAGAKTFTVNAGLDAINQPVPPGEEVVCDIGTGMNECSLRAAIQAANVNPGPDIIEIELVTLGLMAGLVDEDDGFSGDLDIRCSQISECENESLIITGGTLLGDDVSIIEAAGLFDRAFHIVDPIEVTIRNLDVRNTNAGSSSGDGTAIWNLGTLTLENVTVRDSTGRTFIDETNTVTDADSAILNSGIMMTLNDVSVIDTLGDGIHAGSGRMIINGLASTGNSVAGLKTLGDEAIVEVVGGDLTLSRNAVGFWSSGGRAILKRTADEDACEISDNDLSIPGRFDPSHGVLLVGGFTTIERCNISGNVNEPVTGSGIRNLGTLELVDSRVLQNDEGLRNFGRAVVRGSAIFDHNVSGIENFGTLTVVNSTVSGNASAGIGSRDLTGSAISELRVYSSTIVSNAVVDLRQPDTANLIDVRNSIVGMCQVPGDTELVAVRSLGFNFTMNASCGFDVMLNDQIIPNLIGGTIEATLALNGGSTESHRLLANDNEGNTDVSCPLTDQRGEPRTLGSCDVGAYELSGTGQPPVDAAADGTIFVASDAAGAVFALPADYVNPGMAALPPVLTRGSGLVGPISVTGDGKDILVLDAEQGLVFNVDLDTGIPRVFSSTGELTSPLALKHGPDGDVFVVGQPGLAGGAAVVRIDPMTRIAVSVTAPMMGDPLSGDLQSVDIDENGDLVVSNRGEGVFRIVLDELGDAVAEELPNANATNPSGLENRRTGELLVVDRDTNDVIAVDRAGEGVSIGVAPMVLASPRGIGVESEIGRASDSSVVVTMIVPERDGQLHRIVWDGTTATDTVPILAEIPEGLLGPSSLFGVWILRDLDEDGILDADDDSDSDGLSDEFETGSGVFIDAAHPGTDPIAGDSDADNLLDGFEVANGIDPLTAGENCNPGAPGRPGCDDTQDLDDDGLTNLEEQMAETRANDPDTDNDNLLDGFEVANGFDPNSAGEECLPIIAGRPGCDDTQDPDDDGFTNFQEQMAGTDPNDGDDFLFARVPAVGTYGIWILAPLLLVASRFLFSRRQAHG
jgi:hypothetical protein